MSASLFPNLSRISSSPQVHIQLREEPQFFRVDTNAKLEVEDIHVFGKE